MTDQIEIEEEWEPIIGPRLVPDARRACQECLRLAQEMLDFTLSCDMSFGLTVPNFESEIYSLAEAVEVLSLKNTFPGLVHIYVGGLIGNQTLMIWEPFEAYDTQYRKHSWNQGFGPFKPMGLAFTNRRNLGISKFEQLAIFGEEWPEKSLY